MSEPLQYNDFVRQVFANPQFVFRGEISSDAVQSNGGDRETGVEFKFIFDKKDRTLKYKVYGSPYAVAAGELLCRKFAADELAFDDKLDVEQFRTTLEMPYNYFFILLALEDAWIGLSS